MNVLGGVRAFPPDPAAAPPPQDSAVLPGALPEGLPAGSVARLLNSGWTISAANADPGGDAGLALATGAGDALFVVTGALTVQFDEALTEAEVEQLLVDRGLHVRRKLGFGDLYLVSGSGSDSVAVAVELNGLDQVRLAEPVLVEPLATR